jgi:ATP phosphoribosyltransferase
MQTRKKMRVALQKSGRLAESSQYLLAKCGLKAIATKNQLLVQDDEFGIDFIYARDDDIPGFIETGICDLGIIGRNLLDEYRGQNPNALDTIQIVMPLGFAKCRLSIAVPKTGNYQQLTDIEGKIIATSYPNTIRQFLAKNNIRAQVVTMHGSVELAPQIGIADLICDLISSGATLKENGLQELAPVTVSEAILISHKTQLNAEKQALLQLLTLRINGILNADKNKYVMLHIEREKLAMLSKILPGSESPTVLELQGIADKVAVHVVTHEQIFWETIEKLKKIGASSILVLPIEKMIA